MKHTQKNTGLAELMRERGDERHDLMRALDVSEATVRRWQRGEGLTVAVLNRLADHYEVSTDTVLGRKTKA